MTIHAFDQLICPLDATPLQRHDSCWRCPQGHSFDIASQGYLHLLPVQMKRSRDPGDSKDMVSARRRFLGLGHYQPIASAVSAATLAAGAGDQTLNCLDAGCGEGYYLQQLIHNTPDNITLALAGLDISKWAVLAAAKADKRSAWIVGTNARLPIQDASLDRLLCLFGFPVYPEFLRALKPGGRLIQVDAGPQHLRELREIIYPSLKPERSGQRENPAGFECHSQSTLNFSFKLDTQAQIADLLLMTPHLFRATAEGRARAQALHSLQLTAEVTISCYESLKTD